jgi:hypothetical protein
MKISKVISPIIGAEREMRGACEVAPFELTSAPIE